MAVAAVAVVCTVVVAAVHVIAVLVPFLVCLCSDDSVVVPGVVASIVVVDVVADAALVVAPDVGADLLLLL